MSNTSPADWQRQQPYVAPAPQYAYIPLMQAPAKTNGLAVAGMVLGIVWVYWIGSILAVIFGHVALSQIKKNPGQYSGRGMAIAAVVLGWIGVAILIIVLLAAAGSSSRSGY
jgi:hypothetical protein